MDTTNLATHTLTRTLLVELRSVDGSTVPVPTELSYDSSDPYALTVCFYLHDGPVPWTFARELLSGGLVEPTGDGDVHVWPCLDDDGFAVVAVELCSPHGNALVEIRAADVVDFVEHTHVIVAPGKETAHLDVDTAINAFWASDNA
jgi:hypothetical protein